MTQTASIHMASLLTDASKRQYSIYEKFRDKSNVSRFGVALAEDKANSLVTCQCLYHDVNLV